MYFYQCFLVWSIIYVTSPLQEHQFAKQGFGVRLKRFRLTVKMYFGQRSRNVRTLGLGEPQRTALGAYILNYFVSGASSLPDSFNFF